MRRYDTDLACGESTANTELAQLQIQEPIARSPLTHADIRLAHAITDSFQNVDLVMKRVLSLALAQLSKLEMQPGWVPPKKGDDGRRSKIVIAVRAVDYQAEYGVSHKKAVADINYASVRLFSSEACIEYENALGEIERHIWCHKAFALPTRTEIRIIFHEDVEDWIFGISGKKFREEGVKYSTSKLWQTTNFKTEYVHRFFEILNAAHGKNYRKSDPSELEIGLSKLLSSIGIGAASSYREDYSLAKKFLLRQMKDLEELGWTFSSPDTWPHRKIGKKVVSLRILFRPPVVMPNPGRVTKAKPVQQAKKEQMTASELVNLSLYKLSLVTKKSKDQIKAEISGYQEFAKVDFAAALEMYEVPHRAALRELDLRKS